MHPNIPELHFTRKDFDVQFFSGTGPGGQNRNKVKSCCRIAHIPTGLKAQSTQHRERGKNQDAAFKELAKRVIAHYTPSSERGVSTEVIRTYHEPDNRVKDHLTGFQQPYSIVVEGNHLHDMIQARRDACALQSP